MYSSAEIAAIEIKLAAARTRLILDKPFLGALVLRLPLVLADSHWCKTTATDAKALYYNPDYIEPLNLAQTQFILAHEALHCALSHFARRHHRDKFRWDIACDFAINQLLVAEGMTLTSDAIPPNPEFEGLTAEEIYPLLDEDDRLTPHDDHLYDQESESDGGAQEDDGGQGDSKLSGGQGGKGQQDQGGASKPKPLTPNEQEQLAVQWSQRMAGAAQNALQSGKLGGALARMIDHLLQPQLPWRNLLARYMTATARNDYNYSRPSRREGEAIMPSLKSHELKVVVALDTSGSVSDEEMRQFLSEVNAIKAQMAARVTLLACDAELADDGPWVYEPWEAFSLPREFIGGGGTDFEPAIRWAEEQSPQPDLLLYFTDAQGHFPSLEPPFPVIWLVKGKQQVPWGQRIQLN
ncbi:hypothetical protein D5085_14215 [Ectothiorhodospiraceae bacterium BW-2]|nr:hypothetical protein D5085_14215 [Ectothiorhodospiraceae bacterium BW-2]